MTQPHNFLLLGSGAHFTCEVIQQLLNNDCLPVAYVQFGSQPADTTYFANIAVESPRPVLPIHALINPYDIDFYYQNSFNLGAWIRQNNIDFLLAACWPELISAEIISSVNCAAVNLHPSLLPAFRGFDPITDQLNSGRSSFGVSLHLLNESFDCGDIVLQQMITVAPTQTRLDIESSCAETGAQLFVRALQSYSDPGWRLIKQSDR